eukprot:CAMPEP_0172514584 /NCGR_PEP_ID=MMETSP1066-20121228/261185_1 /TAXON_ID=671091 /ORGANISM="Coscinodiscus wailesii, Strain CCMP2513" /LENGTH=265 /DNA_ID=CAMNT_0013295309 /DNA_START=198 /DNA_END=991 /DNA_ORIENTATION=+
MNSSKIKGTRTKSLYSINKNNSSSNLRSKKSSSQKTSGFLSKKNNSSRRRTSIGNGKALSSKNEVCKPAPVSCHRPLHPQPEPIISRLSPSAQRENEKVQRIMSALDHRRRSSTDKSTQSRAGSTVCNNDEPDDDDNENNKDINKILRSNVTELETSLRDVISNRTSVLLKLKADSGAIHVPNSAGEDNGDDFYVTGMEERNRPPIHPNAIKKGTLSNAMSRVMQKVQIATHLQLRAAKQNRKRRKSSLAVSISPSSLNKTNEKS